MGSATLVGSKPMGTQTEALVHESSRLLRVLAARSSKGSRVLCPMLEEVLVVLSQALVQPTLIQHVGFTLQGGALVDEHPLGITVLALLVFEPGGSDGPRRYAYDLSHCGAFYGL